jgi:hypothetical protein
MDKRTIFVIFLFFFAVTPLVMIGCGVLADGGIYHFKCLGDVEGNRWLDGRTNNGSVGLAPTTTGSYTGTSWQALEVEPGIYHIKCLGDVEGNRWLDGRTNNGSVGLAPTTTGSYTGTSWQALEVEPAQPDSNPNNGFDDLKSSSFNITTPETKPIVTTTITKPSPAAPAPEIAPAPTIESHAESWQKTFGGSGNDWANSVQQTSDGRYIIAGYTDSLSGVVGTVSTDAWLIKTDASGNKLWDKTFGGSGNVEANSVQQTGDGGYILAGSTDSPGAGGPDAWLIKTDANGN